MKTRKSVLKLVAANASLIATAPELLEAAKGAMVALEGGCDIVKYTLALGRLGNAILAADPEWTGTPERKKP